MRERFWSFEWTDPECEDEFPPMTSWCYSCRKMALADSHGCFFP